MEKKIDSFNQFIDRLNEWKTSVVTKPVSVEVVIELSDHAVERQNREGAVKVTKEEIMKTIDKATNRIVKYLVIGKLELSQRVLLRDHSNDLNVVIALKRQPSSLALRLEVLTVMKVKDFRNAGNTYVIDLENQFIPSYKK